MGQLHPSRLYFYDLPRTLQLAVLADMAYDDVAAVDSIDHDGLPVYIIRSKLGRDSAYNVDGTRWNDKKFLDIVGWQ
jgi:hypothetical protein